MNVVAFRQDNNGDVILAGPALRALRAGCGRLVLVCGPSGAAAAHALPGIDRVVVAEAPWIEANPGAFDAARVEAHVGVLRSLHADLAVIFTSFHQSPLPNALLARLAGIGRVVAISVAYSGSLLDLRHQVDADIHEVERALSLANAAGFPLPADDDGRLRVQIGPTNPYAHEWPYVVVHPGASVAARAWHPERSRALVAALVRDGKRVLVTGGATDVALCAAVAGSGAISTAGATDFPTFARIVADADAIVCGNTAAAHVAAAVGTPVVELFAPTIPASRFRPWMVEHVLLGDQTIACRGCRARECPIPGQPCLDVVSVRDVLDAVAHVRRTADARVVA